jgi:putative mycofactocin binding protein MftB
VDTGFDLDTAWQLHRQVALRPEPFGAMLYHFGNRKLSFLKNQTVVTVVRSLNDHPTARSACVAAGIADTSLPTYQKALAALARTNMICPRTTSAAEAT